MPCIITSDHASDILDLFRSAKFDAHVLAYKRERFLVDTKSEFALRDQAVAACAAQMIARLRAARAHREVA